MPITDVFVRLGREKVLDNATAEVHGDIITIVLTGGPIGQRSYSWNHEAKYTVGTTSNNVRHNLDLPATDVRYVTQGHFAHGGVTDSGTKITFRRDRS
jgi:hypothetical protein